MSSDTGGGGGKDASVNDGTDALIDMVTTKASGMQLTDAIPIEEQRKISHDNTDIHGDDADGEADDDEER